MRLWYIWRKPCAYLALKLTVSKQTETSFHLNLTTQEYHLMHPEQFLCLWYVWRKPWTYHAPKLTLSPKGPKEDSTWQRSPRIPSGASKMVSEAMVRLVQTVDLSCTYTNTISKRDRNVILNHPRHVGVPSGASKMICESMVRLAQTMHLSWIMISTISKRTETSFHLNIVT
jgi:hypothetical protein